MTRLICAALAAVMLCGCGSASRSGFEPGEAIYTPVCAEGFGIYTAGERSSVIRIKNPWQGAQNVDRWVFISRGGERPPKGFEGEVIAAPVDKVACMSSSHTAFLDALGRIDNVCAVSGLRYITNDSLKNRAGRGLVEDAGYEGNINYEMLAVMRPSAVFMYSVAGERLPVYDKLHEMGVPVITLGEYLEPTPLGKAEWIVAMGEVMDCRERAIEIFDAVREDYLASAESARNTTTRPVVMLNAPWRDTWFVPGDQSYMACLLRDAGAEYACAGAGLPGGQSRAINGETAYIYCNRSDFWLNPNDASSLDELRAQNPSFAAVPPVLKGNVWNNNLRSTPGGGSDFWESGAVYPNLILRDLVAILHPETAHGHTFIYYRHLK